MTNLDVQILDLREKYIEAHDKMFDHIDDCNRCLCFGAGNCDTYERLQHHTRVISKKWHQVASKVQVPSCK